MLLPLLQFFASRFLFLALHLESGSFPRPLNAREEAAAFAALRAGDPTARETLIRHNLRLVAHIVKKYYTLPGDQDDLISIGTIGLIKAVNTFDSTRRARFSTYASKCIENAILSPAHVTADRKTQACRTVTIVSQNGIHGKQQGPTPNTASDSGHDGRNGKASVGCGVLSIGSAASRAVYRFLRRYR